MSRAYTVREIDAMRTAIYWREARQGSGGITIKQREEYVEMLLRTYMEGGVDPAEVRNETR
jgi:hypothetical protein